MDCVNERLRFRRSFRRPSSSKTFHHDSQKGINFETTLLANFRTDSIAFPLLDHY